MRTIIISGSVLVVLWEILIVPDLREHNPSPSGALGAAMFDLYGHFVAIGMAVILSLLGLWFALVSGTRKRKLIPLFLAVGALALATIRLWQLYHT